MNPAFLAAIVKNDIEAAGYGDEKLVTALEGVSTPVYLRGNIIKIKYPFYIKRYVASAFDEGEATSLVGDPGKVNHST
jgi:hypothetical protein